MWRLAILTLVACTEHGQVPPGSDAELNPGQTDLFVPELCTSGSPGDLGCPINHISLVVGSDAAFTVRPLLTGLMFPDLTFTAGQAGLVIVNPTIVIGTEQLGPLTVIDLQAAETETLEPITILDAQPTDSMSLRFDSIGVQQ
jgi:hypothetical protein